MIQRKQTIFLLVAVILGMVHFMAWPLFVIQMLASALCVYAIFLYKDKDGKTAYPLGLYVIQEIEAPTGYLVNDEVIEVTITEDGTEDTAFKALFPRFFHGCKGRPVRAADRLR